MSYQPALFYYFLKIHVTNVLSTHNFFKWQMSYQPIILLNENNQVLSSILQETEFTIMCLYN